MKEFNNSRLLEDVIDLELSYLNTDELNEYLWHYESLIDEELEDLKIY